MNGISMSNEKLDAWKSKLLRAFAHKKTVNNIDEKSMATRA